MPDNKRTDVYLAELLILNKGALEVTSVNQFEKAENKFGRHGLTPDEAFHLTSMIAYLRGLLNGLGIPELEIEVLEYIRNETERVKRDSPIYLPTHEEMRLFT